MGPFGENEALGGSEAGQAPSLVGHHRGSLDAKRRVALPKAFRAQIEADPDASFVLCRQLGGDPCLALYPPGRFEAALARLEELKSSVGVGQKAVRKYLRMLRMSAARLVLDKQKRFALTEDQCELAGITKDITFVGAGDHLELWAPERLEDDDEDIDFGELAGQLFG